MRSSNYTDFDIYSVFKYDDATKYFESLTCKSDNDCPEDSPCIGNKCIVPFYCKKGNKSICALSFSDCDGQRCFKEQNICVRDIKCLGGICNELCDNKYYSYDYLLHSFRDYDEYSVGKFTYKSAKKYFEKMDIPCELHKNECPKYTKCDWYYYHEYHYEHSYTKGVLKCKSEFYCKNKSMCSFSPIVKDGVSVIGESACNNDDECITNYCKESNVYSNYCIRLNRAEISKNVMKYGLEDGETCWKASSCLSNKCILDKAFIGFCKEPSDSDSAYSIYYLFFGIPLSIIGLWFYNNIKPYSSNPEIILILSILLFLICFRVFLSTY